MWAGSGRDIDAGKPYSVGFVKEFVNKNNDLRCDVSKNSSINFIYIFSERHKLLNNKYDKKWFKKI